MTYRFLASRTPQTPGRTAGPGPLDSKTAGFSLSPVMLNLAVSAGLILVYNRTFLARAVELLPSRLAFGVLSLAAFFLIFALVSLLSGFFLVRLQKVMLSLLILLSAATSFFTDRFGVLFDPQMIGNILMARPDEAGDLVSGGLVLHLALYGVLPILAIGWVPVKRSGLLRAGFGWIGSIGVGLGLCTVLVLSHYSTFASYRTPARNHVILALQPYAVLSASYTAARLALEPALPAPIATDAHVAGTFAANRPPLFVLMVIGESARAANQGLGGYARDTTPMLAARDVIYFPDTTSCGTATSVSVPCLFSPLPARKFTIAKNHRIENLLDVAKRTGFDVVWIENNRETYGVADRVTLHNYADNGRSDHCPSQRCPDEIVLPEVKDLIAKTTRDTLVVVHLVGSHMNYYDRYPPAFEVFKPVCLSTDLTSCPRQDLVNGYDNSIRYTDHVLGQMIDSLAARSDLASVMLYTSDHGESLGEHGLFAHSTPPLLAPKEQTHVPLLLWLSQPYADASGLQRPCLEARAALPASHDNVFHTLLGLTDIATGLRDEKLNLTAGCSRPPA